MQPLIFLHVEPLYHFAWSIHLHIHLSINRPPFWIWFWWVPPAWQCLKSMAHPSVSLGEALEAWLAACAEASVRGNKHYLTHHIIPPDYIPYFSILFPLLIYLFLYLLSPPDYIPGWFSPNICSPPKFIYPQIGEQIYLAPFFVYPRIQPQSSFTPKLTIPPNNAHTIYSPLISFTLEKGLPQYVSW